MHVRIDETQRNNMIYSMDWENIKNLYDIKAAMAFVYTDYTKLRGITSSQRVFIKQLLFERQLSGEVN